MFSLDFCSFPLSDSELWSSDCNLSAASLSLKQEAWTLLAITRGSNGLRFWGTEGEIWWRWLISVGLHCCGRRARIAPALASHPENSDTPVCKSVEYMWFVPVCVIGIGRTRSSSILHIETPDDIDLSWTFCIFKVLTGWDEKLQHKQPNSPGPSLIYTVANS